MKKYSWIVALLLALSLVIMGCPNDGGKEPEPTPPKEDLVITGSDIVLEVAGTAAPVTIDGNKVTISGTGITSSGFYYAVPDKAKDYNEFEVEFTVVEVKEGAFRLMLKKNTSFDNPSNVTDANHINEFGMDDDKGIGKGVAGATGTTGKWKLSLMDSKKNITFQHQAWVAGGAEVNSTADYTFEVSKITFFGSGEGEPEPEPRPSFVVENPKVVKNSGTTDNVEIAEDYTVTFKANGVVNYAFDFTDTDGNGVDAYDFVKVTFAAEAFASSAWKQFGTTNDMTYYPNKNIANGGDVEVEFELVYCRNGISIQRWGGTGDMTIKVTKLVFEKGERLPVTFRLGEYAGTGTAPVYPSYFVKDTKIGPQLPAAPFWPGNLFTGWYKGATAVTATTDVDATFNRTTLTAHWAVEPTVTDFTVSFVDADKVLWEGAATVGGSGASYTFLNDSTKQYGPYAVFKITLPATVRLAYFDKVSFSYKGEAGDFNYKDVFLIALPTGAGGYQSGANDGAVAYGKKASGDATNAVSLSIDIDKSKAFANLNQEGDVWIGFYIHAGSGNTTPTSYTISNVVFSQNPKD
jgi:hypothetical protein